MIKEPMLAGRTDGSNLQYPLLASPKLDGVRAFVWGGVVYSRKLKPIPNQYIQATLGCPELEGFDGELICGDPTAPDAFRTTSSAVMSIAVEPDEVTFHVFDVLNLEPSVEYSLRLYHLSKYLKGAVGVRKSLAKLRVYVEPLAHTTIMDAEQLEVYEAEALQAGYEGVMLRSPSGPYKQGRSTAREGYLLKLKRFEDSEAEVLGFEQQMHNENTAETNELGRTKRSSKKAGLVGAGVLGALKVRDCKTGVEFSVGSGFKADERASLWQQRKALVGKYIKYRFFPTGSKDKPRFPTYLGFRDPIDF